MNERVELVLRFMVCVCVCLMFGFFEEPLFRGVTSFFFVWYGFVLLPFCDHVFCMWIFVLIVGIYFNCGYLFWWLLCMFFKKEEIIVLQTIELFLASTTMLSKIHCAIWKSQIVLTL